MQKVDTAEKAAAVVKVAAQVDLIRDKIQKTKRKSPTPAKTARSF